MSNAGNTKYKLDPIFKGTITCRTSIHIAPLKYFPKRRNRMAVGSLKDQVFLALFKLLERDYQ